MTKATATPSAPSSGKGRFRDVLDQRRMPFRLHTRAQFRTLFVSGLLVVLPLAVTYVLLRWLFAVLDGIVQPFARLLLGVSIPGLGLVGGLLLVLMAGAVVRNGLGRRIVSGIEHVMLQIPFARTIYGATRQIADAILLQDRGAFRAAVLLEWPARDCIRSGLSLETMWGCRANAC